MESLSVFSAIVTAIVLEAAPFLLLGAVISAAFEVFLPEGGLSRLTPRGRLAQIAFGLISGMFLPTCECGVVPVARRLMAKGVPARTALAFMLSAPVVNPVVLASTYVAFRADLSMVVGRVGLVLLPAVVLAFVLGELPAHRLLRDAGPRRPGDLPMAHDHGPDCARGRRQGRRRQTKRHPPTKQNKKKKPDQMLPVDTTMVVDHGHVVHDPDPELVVQAEGRGV